jgi:predicted amino acid dehydrogenase
METIASISISTSRNEQATHTKSRHERCLGRFGFLIHPTTADDLYASGPVSLSEMSARQRGNWERWIASWSERHYEPGVAYHLPKICSQAGGYAEGWLIAIPLTPNQMMHLKPHDRRELMGRCIEIAKELDVDMLGLGAFTSIVTRNGVDIAGCGVNITTGNSLTAMAAAESLKLAARQRGRELAHAQVGIVGAAGSVGRLACKALAMDCGRLTLFGNPANPSSMQKLKAVAGEIYVDAVRELVHGRTSGVAAALLPVLRDLSDPYRAALAEEGAQRFSRFYDVVVEAAQSRDVQCPIHMSVDPGRDLPKMQFLISATSHGSAFIDVGLLAPSAVVCDAARPADVLVDVRESRPDVFVYEGGLVALPEKISFGRRNVIGCEPGINLACLSETMVLAMSGVRRDYSIGTEPSFVEAREVLRLAEHHGFRIFVPEGKRKEAASRPWVSEALGARAA